MVHGRAACTANRPGKPATSKSTPAASARRDKKIAISTDDVPVPCKHLKGSASKAAFNWHLRLSRVPEHPSPMQQNRPQSAGVGEARSMSWTSSGGWLVLVHFCHSTSNACPFIALSTLQKTPGHANVAVPVSRGIEQACMSLMNGDLSPGFSCFLVRAVEVDMQVMHITESGNRLVSIWPSHWSWRGTQHVLHATEQWRY